MRAIVVRQPWATLIAEGHKTIETRPAPPNGPMRPDGVRGLPGCSLDRGERIAIVAGKTKGDYRDPAWTPLLEPTMPGSIRAEYAPLPLGAVVCTVTVDDVWPCDDTMRLDLGNWRNHDGGDRKHRVMPFTYQGDDLCCFVDPDQLPLGDFSPGRWGWLLSDPQPITKPCEYHKIVTHAERHTYCNGTGRVPADPIPCKGRQGVFELPADVAEAVQS